MKKLTIRKLLILQAFVAVTLSLIVGAAFFFVNDLQERYQRVREITEPLARTIEELDLLSQMLSHQSKELAFSHNLEEIQDLDNTKKKAFKFIQALREQILTIPHQIVTVEEREEDWHLYAEEHAKEIESMMSKLFADHTVFEEQIVRQADLMHRFEQKLKEVEKLSTKIVNTGNAIGGKLSLEQWRALKKLHQMYKMPLKIEEYKEASYLLLFGNMQKQTKQISQFNHTVLDLSRLGSLVGLIKDVDMVASIEQNQIIQRIKQSRQLLETIKGLLEEEHPIQDSLQALGEDIHYLEGLVLLDNHSLVHLRYELLLSLKDSRKQLGTLRNDHNELESELKNLLTLNSKAAKLLNEEWRQRLEKMQQIAYTVLFVAIILIILLGNVIFRLIAKPMENMAALLFEMANGNLQIRVKVTRDDEIGRASKSFNEFLDGLQELIHQIGSSITLMSSLAKEVKQESVNIKSIAENTLSKSHEVSNAVESITSKIKDVSVHSEEIALSATDITYNTTRVTKMSDEGAKKSQETQEFIIELGAQSQEIRGTIDLIAKIAGQTNLLALNASIIAANSGEKSIGVIAKEVKELANETEDATEDISGRATEMQNSVSIVIEKIDDIGQTIRVLNKTQTSVADAMLQQQKKTSDISLVLQQATESSDKIAKNTIEVVEVAEHAKVAADHGEQHARKIDTISQELQRLINHFKY